ncbi:AMP-dependent synthetase [Lactococcus lactis subsp. lactis NCDO 2118]|uniref:AMP-dependent synthetase n=1 Tax=Lactococcus lactis subsp. lactis NCDO 2118 TaxID=1117941 RepID=A0ABC8A675_LACLL|nr:class I adenylate-forming enzyme family protein [Lactococcus lactis]ADA64976.1 AMP-dependent synthetase and ligase family protein [Lactococcus lactis subsp. lactis KF147]AII12741.1 AMP-dependent synthetase [Lactococcus lactis subsp. lactis NCDO 2118]
MWKFIEDTLKKTPCSVISSANQKLTYGSALSFIQLRGRQLKKIVPKHSKCAILCGDEMNTALSILICWFAGVVPIPLSHNYGKRHYKKVLLHCLPDLLITDLNKPDVEESIPRFEITSGICIGSSPSVVQEKVLSDIAAILYTSGTTGEPKGILLTEQGLLMNIVETANYFNITQSDKIIIVRPLYHCAAFTGEFLVALSQGGNIEFFNSDFNPMKLISQIESHNISICGGTPTLFKQMAKLLGRTKRILPLKKIAISGECLTKESAVIIRDVFKETKIFNVYGQTEASPRISYLPPQYFDEFPESVGILLKSTQIKICDKDTDEEVSDNSNGVIYVKSPSIMKGYYRNQNLTQRVIQEGWLRTNDFGFVDERGFLYILSRVDDLIIKAGMNIYPKEIENIVNDFQEVSECLVYQSASGGIGIDVVLDEKYYNFTKQKFLNEISGNLPKYQIPTEVQFVAKLERGISGKLIRRKNRIT